MHSETIDNLRNADRNKLGLVVSVLPGAGHLLKGHKTLGITLLAGTILMTYVASLLPLAKFGISVAMVPLLWWIGIAASAYLIPDLTDHTSPPRVFLGEAISAENDADEHATLSDEERIDEAMEESFPASDPPSWSLGVKKHFDNEGGLSQMSRGA